MPKGKVINLHGGGFFSPPQLPNIVFADTLSSYVKRGHKSDAMRPVKQEAVIKRALECYIGRKDTFKTSAWDFETSTEINRRLEQIRLSS